MSDKEELEREGGEVKEEEDDEDSAFAETQRGHWYCSISEKITIIKMNTKNKNNKKSKKKENRKSKERYLN